MRREVEWIRVYLRLRLRIPPFPPYFSNAFAFGTCIQSSGKSGNRSYLSPVKARILKGIPRWS